MSTYHKEYCRSCFAEVTKDENAVSLDGIVNMVCSKCWQEMRPFERLFLWILMRPNEEDGLGLADLLPILPMVLRKSFRHLVGHDVEYERCQECNPRGE